MNPQPRLPATYSEILRRFRGQDDLELAAAARLIERAHVRHGRDVADATTQDQQQEAEAQRLLCRSADLSRYWGSIAARHHIKSLLADYAYIMTGETIAAIRREADWFLSDISNIEARGALSFNRSMPPPAYLACPVSVIFADNVAAPAGTTPGTAGNTRSPAAATVH